jgi:hypothetical protein
MLAAPRVGLQPGKRQPTVSLAEPQGEQQSKKPQKMQKVVCGFRFALGVE